MENLLARFRRGRTKSLSGTSALTPAGPTLQTALAPAPTQPTTGETQPSPLEQKIHPDLDSLVANWTPSAPVASVSDPHSTSSTTPPPFSTALRPSTRRHSIDGTTPVLRPAQANPHLDDLPELPVPVPFTPQPPPPPPTRTRRFISRLRGSSTPPSSTINISRTSTPVGWSTFGRRVANDTAGNSRPHLTDFGERGRGSPALSQGTSLSLSHSFSPSRSPSQVNLGTPSTTSQHLDDSATHSISGHGHQATTPGSELPSPSSAFTFGSQGRASGRASTSASPPPPMPPLDHPAFRGTGRAQSASTSQSQLQLPQSQQSQRRFRERHPRSSSSLPSMHSTSRRKRFRGGAGDRTKAQDIFVSLSRPGSTRRRASTESSSNPAGDALGQNREANREVVFLALGAGGSEKEGKQDRTKPTIQIGPDGGDHTGDLKLDARAKRVGGSSDSGEPFVWSDIPAHSPESSSSTMESKKTGATLVPPSLASTAATPKGSPARPPQTRAASEGPTSALPTPTPSRSHSDGNKLGKRKAEDVGTPPKDSKATVTVTPDPRPHNISHSSHAPSSFHRQKRAKLTLTPDQSESPPRPSSRAGSATAANMGTGSSRGAGPNQHSRQVSRSASRASSLPISALVAPHAPSVARSAGGTAYHMRDPRKPPRVQPTGWALAFGDGRWWQGGGSPLHAWLFFVGFVLFPLWWVAGFCVPVPRTRRIGGDAEEKGRAGLVVLDDPQVEFDARSWRRRCRIMAGISLVTYIPFIVLLAVFVPRR